MRELYAGIVYHGGVRKSLTKRERRGAVLSRRLSVAAIEFVAADVIIPLAAINPGVAAVASTPVDWHCCRATELRSVVSLAVQATDCRADGALTVRNVDGLGNCLIGCEVPEDHNGTSDAESDQGRSQQVPSTDEIVHEPLH